MAFKRAPACAVVIVFAAIINSTTSINPISRMEDAICLNLRVVIRPSDNFF